MDFTKALIEKQQVIDGTVLLGKYLDIFNLFYGAFISMNNAKIIVIYMSLVSERVNYFCIYATLGMTRA